MLDDIIQALKLKLFQHVALDVICYYYINNLQNEIHNLDQAQFTGEVEQIALSSFADELADRNELAKIAQKLKSPIYRKHLSIYHFLGLARQDSLARTDNFGNHLQERFDIQSIRYKYLITKVFEDFENSLKKCLSAQIETNEHSTQILRHLYFESDLNRNHILRNFKEKFEDLDIIDLLLLEDLRDVQSIGYDRLQEKLFNDILWCATEIQSKHKVLNNNEDQYNSLFQSLLSAKKYRALDQAQRGVSTSGSQYGELDIAIFSEENRPLSILEGFIISSVNSDYIEKHLKKLSENYDPNGLQNNYAVIYAKSDNFVDFWKRYKVFVSTIDYKYEMRDGSVRDVTSSYPQIAGIKIGVTKHQNRGICVKVYHIFMDMQF